MVSRRSFALAGAATMLAGCVRSQHRVDRPLGIASITVADAMRRDPAGTLRRLRAMGYTHFGLPLAPLSPRNASVADPRALAAMVENAGLTVGAVRLGYGIPIAEQMRLARSIGASIVVQSASPVFFEGPVPGQTSRAPFEQWLPRLGELAAAARSEGLRMAYHNHHWDHVPLDGQTPLALIAERFAPGEVDFEIDLGWAAVAGVEPLALVQQLGRRVVAMHWKDFDPARGPTDHDRLVVPGAGVLGYARLLAALPRLTDAIGYVEIDKPADGLIAAGEAAHFIRRAREQGVADV